MLSELRTMWEVLKHTFTKAETVQYPEEMPYLAPRYRGRIVLTRDPDGEERCVACNLCAAVCPRRWHLVSRVFPHQLFTLHYVRHV